MKDVATIRTGVALTRRMREESAEEVAYIGVGDLTETGGLVPRELLETHCIRLSARHRGLLCIPGDILIAARGTVLRTGLVGPEQAGALASANLLVVRTRPDCLLPEMLAAYLRTSKAMGELQELARSSSGQLSLSVQRLGTWSVPVPPLATQKRIAALQRAFQAYDVASRSAMQEYRLVMDGMIETVVDDGVIAKETN